MRIFDQAAVDAVRTNANGRRYMMQGIYAAGTVFGDKCSFPRKCVFMGSVFGNDCHFGRGCYFYQCLIGSGAVIGEGSQMWFTVVGHNSVIKKYITTECEQMDVLGESSGRFQNGNDHATGGAE